MEELTGTLAMLVGLAMTLLVYGLCVVAFGACALYLVGAPVCYLLGKEPSNTEAILMGCKILTPVAVLVGYLYLRAWLADRKEEDA